MPGVTKCLEETFCKKNYYSETITKIIMLWILL